MENAGRVTQLARWGRGAAGEAAFSLDGRQLAIASTIGLYIYNVSDLTETRFIPTRAILTDVAYSPDGRTLATSSEDYTVKLWDVQSGQLIRSLEGHTNWVSSVELIPKMGVLQSK